MNIKLSPAQTVILHTVLSIVLSALVAGYTAAIDQVHGAFNVTLFITVFCGAAGVSLIAGLATLRNNPQIMQAMLDTVGEIQASHNQLVQTLLPVLTQLPSPTQQHPPVVVNLAQPKAEQPVNIGTENVTSSQQAPQSQQPVYNQPTNSLPPQPLLSQPPQPQFQSPEQIRHFGDSMPMAAISQAKQSNQ